MYVLRAAAHRREVLYDEADELDRPGARRVMRKDHRGPQKTPVAERDHRTRPRALTRETREGRGGRLLVGAASDAQTRVFS